MCAKNYQNWFMYVKVIANQMWEFFGHSEVQKCCHVHYCWPDTDVTKAQCAMWNDKILTSMSVLSLLSLSLDVTVLITSLKQQ